ncbi:MAG TPA: TetR/AcrR family transcriptional regulator [Longimicrobiales bacterium]
MGSKERRQRECAETRQRILDAARDLFVQCGYETTTMRAVADRIEFTPTAIYHHFRNKEALLRELCVADFGPFVEAFQRIGRIEDPVERLERIGAAYVDFALENPMQYRFLFMTERPGTIPDHEAGGGEPPETVYAFLRDTCAEAIAGGYFSPEYDDPDEVAQMLWGAMHGLVSIHIAGCGRDSIDLRDVRATAARLRETIRRGMLPR